MKFPPLIVDPITEKPSVGLTLFFIAYNVVIAGALYAFIKWLGF